MALATKCPHCQTTFRVAHDQLKLRAGLVRCGTCKEIFNGVEHLLRPEQLPQSSAVQNSPVTPPNPSSNSAAAMAEETHDQSRIEPTPAAPATSVTHAADSIKINEATTTANAADDLPPVAAADLSVAASPSQITIESSHNDPLQRMTLMDIAGYDELGDDDAARPEVTGPHPLPQQNADAPDELSQAIEELQRRPWRRAKKGAASKDADDAYDAEFAEPAFVKRARQQERINHLLRILMPATSCLLLIMLFAQGAYAFRNQLAASYPQTLPALAKACEFIGCQVDRPSQIDAVSLESSELQALPSAPNTFVLTTLLRNRSTTVQGWPNIELTLNDGNEKPIARRVFTPREYLPSVQELKKGFALNSEQQIKLFFELPQLKASGYRVYLFYP